MSSLTASDKRKLERLLDMGGGYVLNFSNRTFAEFILDSTGRNIDDSKYNYASGSKANRLRAFWTEEPDVIIAKLLTDLLDYLGERPVAPDVAPLLQQCRQIIGRLAQNSHVHEADALTSTVAEADFDALSKEIRTAIDRNELQSGLDRLHTFTVKYVRALCQQHGIVPDRDKPLHSLFGEYVKRLHSDGYLESEMTSRILRSSISVLDAFNQVRNTQSLAHDNRLLNYDEALLIFNHVAASVRFLRDLEKKLRAREVAQPESIAAEDDIPF